MRKIVFKKTGANKYAPASRKTQKYLDKYEIGDIIVVLDNGLLSEHEENLTQAFDEDMACLECQLKKNNLLEEP